MCNNIVLEIPGTNMVLRPGCRVKLGRFETRIWDVNHGWFTFGGNRPFCGWYLSSGSDIKPLQKPDLDDIYMVER